MKKYECNTCGYIYDPEVGDPDSGIEPGTAFEDIQMIGYALYVVLVRMISVQLRINQTIMIEYKACSFYGWAFSVGKKRLNGRVGKHETSLLLLYLHLYNRTGVTNKSIRRTVVQHVLL